MNRHMQVLTTATLLMTFAVIGAGTVGYTYTKTYEQIKRNEQMIMLRNLNNILPADSYDNDLLADKISLPADPRLGTTEPSNAYLAYRNNIPVAVVLSPIAPNGYNGPIDLLVGINYDGSITGVRVVKHRETPGLGDAIESSRSKWILGFANRSLENPTAKKWKVKRDGGAFDQFTGATITPRAVVKAVHAALVYFSDNRDKLFRQRQQIPLKQGDPDGGRTDQDS